MQGTAKRSKLNHQQHQDSSNKETFFNKQIAYSALNLKARKSKAKKNAESKN
jgi:hypothetical protein